ncbi:calmodulin-4-like [Haliotis asinina]|uniref:calmodulin-4-like n=1 Tax=Haliotis asinina TaxID=109174 RepID=UPI00353267D9
MKHLTAKEKKVYTDVFNDVDVNGDGCICKSEIGDLCVKLGFVFDDSQIEQLFTELDKDNSGTVTLDEFLSVMQPIKKERKRCATIRRMFKKADVNKDGFLTADELQAALSSAADEGVEPLPMSEVEHLISTIDINGDGKLNYEEFLLLLKPAAQSS